MYFSIFSSWTEVDIVFAFFIAYSNSSKVIFWSGIVSFLPERGAVVRKKKDGVILLFSFKALEVRHLPTTSAWLTNRFCNDLSRTATLFPVIVGDSSTAGVKRTFLANCNA